MLKKLLFLMCYLGMAISGHAQDKFGKSDYQIGEFKKGDKVGVWKYYDSAESDTADLIFDYDKGEVVYMHSDLTEYLIKVDSSWVLKKVSRQPRYKGSMEELVNTITRSLRYPDKARRGNKEGRVFLEVELNAEGVISGLQVFNDPNNYFTTSVLKSFKRVPEVWVGAKYEGEAVASKLIIPYDFIIGERVENPSGINLDTFLGKKLDGVVINVAPITENTTYY
ncbi:energy transducer TonB [Limibacter armeniacum]|uniref:energy transducer TonB n=1 Tax=Limibacter armeniacum TaxID=466084 RepID=UPI002FE66800